MTTETEILAMIASVLNPLYPAGTQISHTVLAEIETTPDRHGLTVYMADGTQFKITAEEII